MSNPAPRREFPWWLAILAAAGLAALAAIATDPVYRQILETLSQGIGVTILVTITAFGLAAAFGLAIAVSALSPIRPLREVARLYVEVIRGIPIIVLLLYVAFVAAPSIVTLWNNIGFSEIRTRDIPLLWRAVAALALAYAAFLAEVFRAGIESVDKGQVEAAKALGLTGWQRFRLVVMPQAIRTILPPLGNDFVAMVKDSSLVSVLGVTDITQLGKVSAASSFRYFETYNVVAFLYLTMTIGLSLALRTLERRLRARDASR